MADGGAPEEDREADDGRRPEVPGHPAAHDPEDSEGEVGDPDLVLERAALGPPDRLGHLVGGEDVAAGPDDPRHPDEEDQRIAEQGPLPAVAAVLGELQDLGDGKHQRADEEGPRRESSRRERRLRRGRARHEATTTQRQRV